MAQDTPPRWDRKMQQRLARGEAAALGELYDRFAALVHGLAHRVLEDDASADHTTREVFLHVWENPEEWDPRDGSLRSWIAAVTQRLAAGVLRRQQHGTSPEQVEEKVRAASAAARADYVVTSMPASLRAALELAYFQRRDYRQTAERLGVTDDEARRRLRLGLQLLSSATTRQQAAPWRTALPGPAGPQPGAPHGTPGAPGGLGRAG